MRLSFFIYNMSMETEKTGTAGESVFSPRMMPERKGIAPMSIPRFIN